MDYKKLALGLGAFAGATAALIGGVLVADGFARRRDDTGGSGEGGASTADVTASGEPNATMPDPSTPAARPDDTLAAVTASGEPATAGATDPADTSAEHVPADLLADHAPGAHDRAPPAFRPDMDAPMTPAEREALRPASGRGPSLVSGIPNVADEVVRPAS